MNESKRLLDRNASQDESSAVTSKEKKSILMRMKTKSFLLFHALSHLSFGAKGLDDPNQPLRHQLPFSPPPPPFSIGRSQIAKLKR